MPEENVRVGDALEVSVSRDPRNAAKRGSPVQFEEAEGKVEDRLELKVVSRQGPGILDGTIDPDTGLDHYELHQTVNGLKILQYHYKDGSVYEMVEFCDSSRCDNCCDHEGVPPWVQQTFRMPWTKTHCPMLQRDPDDPSKLAFPPRCTLQMQGGSKDHTSVPVTCLVEPQPAMIEDFIRRWGCTIRFKRLK